MDNFANISIQHKTITYMARSHYCLNTVSLSKCFWYLFSNNPRNFACWTKNAKQRVKFKSNFSYLVPNHTAVEVMRQITLEQRYKTFKHWLRLSFKVFLIKNISPSTIHNWSIFYKFKKSFLKLLTKSPNSKKITEITFDWKI